VIALAALFGWLAVAVYWMTSVNQSIGIVLAGIGVIAAGLGIGALQVRQANYDRLYAVALAPLRRKPNSLPESQRAEQHDRPGGKPLRLYQVGRDVPAEPADQVDGEEPGRPEHRLQRPAEDPQRPHVHQQVDRAVVHEHRSEQPVELAVGHADRHGPAVIQDD